MEKNKIRVIISVCGQICSGKTYAANAISEKLNIPIASFGTYVKSFCEKNELPMDRKTLQDVGERFVNENPTQFTLDVLENGRRESNAVIVEGIRHKVIFESIAQIADKKVSIYLEADQKTRYERFQQRKRGDSHFLTFEEFLLLNNHPVEREIEGLKPLCDIVIETTDDYIIDLLTQIEGLIKIK
jgi:cytidylate kinase